MQFAAPNNARFFGIGNFYPDSKAESTYEVSELEVTPPQVTYYCVDNFYIGPARHDLEETLENTGKYTFRSVHFPTASADLQAAALPELDALAAYLRKHPYKKAEVAGHTDNVGKPAENQQLSEARAQAVHAYLTAQGIPPSRLAYRGYGERQPVASNGHAEGRRQNRRVTCILK